MLVSIVTGRCEAANKGNGGARERGSTGTNTLRRRQAHGRAAREQEQRRGGQSGGASSTCLEGCPPSHSGRSALDRGARARS